MALTQQEQLTHLMTHIGLSDDLQSYFINGRLTQVIVSKQDKLWTFKIA